MGHESETYIYSTLAGFIVFTCFHKNVLRIMLKGNV